MVPVHPISINSTYHSDKRHGMTRDAREWFANVFYQLSQPGPAAELARIRNNFDKSKHGVSVQLLWKVPASVLYTKAGDLSSRSIDLSNCEKSIIDALFLPKNFGTNVPYQCENLNIDDRYLRRLFSEKVASSDEAYELKVVLKLIPR